MFKSILSLVERDGAVEAASTLANVASKRAIETLLLKYGSGLTEPLEGVSQGRLLIVSGIYPDNARGTGYGDEVFKIAAIQAVQAAGYDITVMTPEDRAWMHNTKSLSISPRDSLWSIIKQIRGRFDHIILLHPVGAQAILVSMLSRATGVRALVMGDDATRASHHQRYYQEEIARIVPGVDPSMRKARIRLSRPEGTHIPHFATDKRYLAINIGAKSGLRNFQDWKQVLDQVFSQGYPADLDIVLVGTGRFSQEDFSIVPEGNLIDFTNKGTLEDTAYVMSQCDYLVGTDGGNLNLAIATSGEEGARLKPKNIISINSVVHGEKRQPIPIFPVENIVNGHCGTFPNGCFHINKGMACPVTGKNDTHPIPPPCLTNEKTINSIVIALRRILGESNTISIGS